jgi:hypothetical protein
MSLYRHSQYACGHPGPDEFVQPCEHYPTCNRRRFQNGIFTKRTNCLACAYDKEKRKALGKSFGSSSSSSRGRK